MVGRLVGTIDPFNQVLIKKTFGRHSLTCTELETTLHEVKSCVNSRPLTYVSDGADAMSPLTTAHFLLGHAGGFYERSTPTPVACGSDLALRFAMRQSLLDKFWEIWSSDYIRNLPPWRGAQGKCDLRGAPCAGRPATSVKVAAGCYNAAISGPWRSGHNRWGQNSVW